MQKLAVAHDLQARLTHILQTVEREFAHLSDEQLRWQPGPGRWSIIECLQHLCLAERFYIRNIQERVDQIAPGQSPPANQSIRHGWLGKAMRFAVDPQVKLKVPAPKMIRPRPAAELVPASVIGQFLDLQTALHTQLDKAVYLDWNREKVSTLFSSWPGLDWLKIRLGDAFQMLVAHTERHLKQAMRVKAEMATFTPTKDNL